jgi:ceramide glucosyltransferase
MLGFTTKILILLWPICILLVILGCAYAFVTAAILRQFAQKSVTALSSTASLTILKPLYGVEPGLEANLASFCDQNYRGKIQLVLGLANRADPAVAVVQRLRHRFPGHDIVFCTDPRVHGINGKISNLINMLPHVRHDLLVLSDSDIRVGPDYLRDVVATLAQPGVGLVTCLYRGLPVAGIWSQLSAAAIDQHFLPSVLVGLKFGLARPCFGSTIALRRQTLNRIGGFDAVADRLADDHAIGMAVRGLGLRVEIPPILVNHICSETSLADLLRHELRWARTIRSIDPMGYVGSAVTNPLPFALCAGALSGLDVTGIALLLLALACRMLVSIQVGKVGSEERSRAPLWLSPIRDLLSFAIFLASFLPGRVVWRGHRFVIQTDGTLRPS